MGVDYDKILELAKEAQEKGIEPTGVICRSAEEAEALSNWIGDNYGHESIPGSGFPQCQYCGKPLSEWRANEECLKR